MQELDIANLYAVGETAYTDCMVRIVSPAITARVPVFADARRRHPGKEKESTCALPIGMRVAVTDADEQIVIAHKLGRVASFHVDYVGIVRTNKRLERALHRIQLLQNEIRSISELFHISAEPAGAAQSGNQCGTDRSQRTVAHETVACITARLPDLPHSAPPS